MKRRILAAALAFAVTTGAFAVRLDDSASPRRRFDLTPRWEYDGESANSPDRMNALVADVPKVEVRLNTVAWVGKRGRIYLVLPPVVMGLRTPHGMRVEWRTHGTFQDGSALPGDRALLYDGPITSPLTQETFDFVIHLDARYMGGGLRFDPEFEFEPSP
jgi:hypothetical protein